MILLINGRNLCSQDRLGREILEFFDFQDKKIAINESPENIITNSPQSGLTTDASVPYIFPKKSGFPAIPYFYHFSGPQMSTSILFIT